MEGAAHCAGGRSREFTRIPILFLAAVLPEVITQMLSSLVFSTVN